MRLFFPSLAAACYVFASLVLPLHVRLWAKAAMGLGLLLIALKYAFYEAFGASFFNPDLPLPVLLGAECLYASLIILFFLALLKDVAALLLRLGRCFGATGRLPLGNGQRAWLLCALALTCGIWGSWQAVRVPDVRTVPIAVPGLPPELEGFSLVQLTDLHIGPLLKKAWLEQVVAKTNALSADAVVITGDLLDGSPAEMEKDLRPLASLRAKHGVFCVTGNHEYYYNADAWLPIFRAMGLDVLENEHRVLPGGLVIGGIPDATAAHFGHNAPDAGAAFAGAPEGMRVLLSHRPSSAAPLPSPSAQLQLSGHTHGGLLFFLAPLVGAFNHGYVNGLYATPQGGTLYVSPGTGLWSGFSCRLGVPSEITRFLLKNTD